MLKIAMEIPTSKLVEWTPHTDLDFVLAHKVLGDSEYAQFFQQRRLGRELILDNSTHEFGYPLPFEDLTKAAALCRADYLIAPDIVNPSIDNQQVAQNMTWMRDTALSAPPGLDIGAVLCGNTFQQRNTYTLLAKAAGVKMMCFTFHMPNRLEWWYEFESSPDFYRWDRVHLLGVSTLDELAKWRVISDKHPQIDWSVDTSKALKFGVQEQRIENLDDLRGGKIRSKEVLELKEFTTAQSECVVHNIKVLQNICKG